MSNIKIITNYHWRKPVYGFELPAKVLAEFDDIDDIADQAFIYYKGEYHLDEFMPIPNQMKLDYPESVKWQGYMSDSYFSGILIKYSEDCEEYQIATYIV